MKSIFLNYKVFFVLSLYLIFQVSNVSAQSTVNQEKESSEAAPVSHNAPKFKVEMSKDTIMIGDQIDIIFTIEKDLTQLIALPEITAEATEGKVEPIGVMVIDTLKVDNRDVTLEARQTITSFDNGRYVFAPLPMLYVDKNLADTIYSDSLVLFVDTYLIDTATYQMADIKPLMQEPFSFSELKYYLRDIFSSIYTYIGIALVIIIALIIWYVRRKRNQILARPPEPPHIIAIRTLEEISNLKLWENGKYKEYYTRLTDAIRYYLVGRYGVNAMEMTSHEIFQALDKLDIAKRDFERLQDLLLLSDFVKFAKVLPKEDECRSSFDNAYFFVEETKLMPLENEEAEDIIKP